MGDEDSLFRPASTYPSVFPIAVTHTEFPSSAKVMGQSSLPYGCIITPFIGRDDYHPASLRLVDSVSQVARCSHCSAYINPFCDVNSLRWFCSLCGLRNTFTRSMTRYRQVDIKTLEETQSILTDYPMPFRSIDGVPLDCEGKMGVPAATRPLVHVFLIQESMSPDALQAVIESLTNAVTLMHSDVQIVLLTFSHRIGIYHLSDGKQTQSSSTSSSSAAAADEFSPVEYIHLAPNDGNGPSYESYRQEELDAAPLSFENVAPQCPLAEKKGFLKTAASLGSCR